MSDPFISEIKIFSFNFPPKGWAACNGQIMPIIQNQALFSLLGTTYGGNGSTTFALPNLQGRVPLDQGNGFTMGQAGGETSHTLVVAEIPSHTHTLMASAAANPRPGTGVVPGPGVALAEAVAATSPATPVANFGTGTPSLAFAANAIGAAGGGQPHPNQQPFTVLNFCMALQGVYPVRN